MEPDAIRSQIIEARGHTLIRGGPGSGKTTVALMRSAREIKRLKLEQQILFLSFSRAAIFQVADRMKSMVSSDQRKRIEMRTFHSWCLDVILSHGHLFSAKAARVIAPDVEGLLRSDFDGDWKTETSRLAAEEGVFVFDLLAAYVADLFERSARLVHAYGSAYPVIVVDEFQDTSEDQWRIVKSLSKHSSVICLADPDQFLFGHIEGVTEERIAEALEYLVPHDFDLSHDNFRSPETGILDYANAVLRGSSIDVPDSVVNISYSGTDYLARLHTYVCTLRDSHQKVHGEEPTIAILSTTNQLVARISAEFLRPNERAPAIDHELVWDAETTAAAGYVVATILEWPKSSRQDAVARSLSAVSDFYRVKFSVAVSRNRGRGSKTSKTTFQKLDREIDSMRSGRPPKLKISKTLAHAFDSKVEFDGNSVKDWFEARNRLQGTNELEEVRKSAQLLRLLRATDSLAWSLIECWDGQSAYVGAVDMVHAVLTTQLTDLDTVGRSPTSLMSMHRSKGKEFEIVIIVEDQYQGRLLDASWDDARIQANRRLLRVGISRAKQRVILIRPENSVPLTR
jgi:DNA helicase-2/ATP-dependent DNA helicase PcrA